MTDLSPTGIERLFTREDGAFLFARWGRPLVPAILGADDGQRAALTGAIRAVADLAGIGTAPADPDLGANLPVLVLHDWDDLLAVPGLDALIPDLPALVARLAAAGANQYRTFRFDADGGIRLALVFLRPDAQTRAVPFADVALLQAVQTVLLWSDTAFRDRAPLVRIEGAAILRPDLGALIRAAYHPALPVTSREPALAYRLAARMGAG